MTEARRRASQAYKERQEREGIKVVSVRLDEKSRKMLQEVSAKQGCSQGEAVKLLLAWLYGYE